MHRGGWFDRPCSGDGVLSPAGLARARIDLLRNAKFVRCSFRQSRRCLPLMRGSTSLRDRRCHVLVVTMAMVMVVFIGLLEGRGPHATSNGRIRPEGRLCLDRLPATATPAFFPCRQAAAFLAGQKSRLTPSSASLRA